jgi:hypothetical protein
MGDRQKVRTARYSPSCCEIGHPAGEWDTPRKREGEKEREGERWRGKAVAFTDGII